MPQEFRKVNGRWVLTGNATSQDMVPALEADVQPQKPRSTPKVRAGRPRMKDSERPMWTTAIRNGRRVIWTGERHGWQSPATADKLRNDLGFVPDRLKAGAAGFLRNPVPELLRIATLGGAREGAGYVIGAADDAARFGDAVVQRIFQRKPQADENGGISPLLDQTVDLAYRAMGLKAPSQMTSAERGYDKGGRALAAQSVLTLFPALRFGALGATTRLGGAVRGGAAFAVGEVLSNYLTDNTGGHIGHVLEEATGGKIKTPFNFEVGRTDRVDAANASLIPQMVFSAGLGAAVGVGSHALRSSARWVRGERGKSRIQGLRSRLDLGGVTQPTEDGARAVAPPDEQTAQAGAQAREAFMRRFGLGGKAKEPPAPEAGSPVQDSLARLESRQPSGVEAAPIPDESPDLEAWLAGRAGDARTPYVDPARFFPDQQAARFFPDQQAAPGPGAPAPDAAADAARFFPGQQFDQRFPRSEGPTQSMEPGGAVLPGPALEPMAPGTDPWVSTSTPKQFGGFGIPDPSSLQEYLRSVEAKRPSGLGLESSPEYQQYLEALKRNQPFSARPGGEDPAARPGGEAPAAAQREPLPTAAEVEQIEPAPDAPEADVLLGQLDELDDLELAQLAASSEPVAEMVNTLLENRPPLQVDPRLREDGLFLPNDKLSDFYREGIGSLEPWAARLGEMDDAQLRSLADPENSPRLYSKVREITGNDSGDFSKADILDAIQAMSDQDGLTLILERLKNLQWARTEDVQAAPVLFQYKSDVNEAGEQRGRSLSGARRWDPFSEGSIKVWRDPKSGQLWVVDGHNRLALAKRLGVETIPITEITATNPQSARTEGALSNINSGQGTAFDAAKLIRDLGITDLKQLRAGGIQIHSGHGAPGLSLSKLPDDLFQRAAENPDMLPKALIIAESGLDHPQMRSAWKALDANPDISNERLRQRVAMGRATASEATSGDTPLLEGTEWDFSTNVEMNAKADLATAMERELRSDKSLFATMARQGDKKIRQVGVVDTEASAELSAEARRALAIFDDLKFKTGPVGDLMNVAAQKVVAGAKPKDVAVSIKKDLAVAIRQTFENNPPTAEPPIDGAPAVAPNEAPTASLFGDAPDAPDAPVVPVISAEQREALKLAVVREAMLRGEVRPPETPIPDASEGPKLPLAQAEAAVAAAPPPPARSSKAAEAARRLARRARLQVALAAEHGIEVETAVLDPLGVKPYRLMKEARRIKADFPDLAADYRAAAKLTGEEARALADEPGMIDSLLLDMPEHADARQAIVDEFRLGVEHAKTDAKLRHIQEQILKDAYGWAERSFDEKKELGLTTGWEPRPKLPEDGPAITPEVLGPDAPGPAAAGGEPSLADMFGEQARRVAESDARLYRRTGEAIGNIRQILDDAEAAGAGAPKPAAPVAPRRPEPVRLSAAADSDAPPFVLPAELSRSAPRYGLSTLTFQSDLDRTAYILFNDSQKASKAAPKFRAAVEAAGLDLQEVIAHGREVKASIKALAAGQKNGALDIPEQPWNWKDGSGNAPLTRNTEAKMRSEVQAKEQQIDEIRAKANEGGCQL